MAAKTLTQVLAGQPVEASAPCRIDMGGTLDISTFYYPLMHLGPCTFNIALDLRTRVRLKPHLPGTTRIRAADLAEAEYPLAEAPFKHPLGLMFAVAAFFKADGVCIEIESSSPPCSALGGSSAAAVALAAALAKARTRLGEALIPPRRLALLAHTLESSVAGVPCGLQDQLAAVYGGVNVWYWSGSENGVWYRRQRLMAAREHCRLRRHLLVAYCGRPHASVDINGRWVSAFLSGKDRSVWSEILNCTHGFVRCVAHRSFGEAAAWMNRETRLRRQLTPDVLDPMGSDLVAAAAAHGCGARFTGAGGGGCVWAIGEAAPIDDLRQAWGQILANRDQARLLDWDIDGRGLRVHEPPKAQP
jgi:D-glycero-alpha-D-manno-heptose-7-phosphate kinase